MITSFQSRFYSNTDKITSPSKFTKPALVDKAQQKHNRQDLVKSRIAARCGGIDCSLLDNEIQRSQNSSSQLNKKQEYVFPPFMDWRRPNLLYDLCILNNTVSG